MQKDFETIYSRIVGTEPAKSGLAGINITNQFLPEQKDPACIGQNLNAAFLIALCGKAHTKFDEAVNYIESLVKDPVWGEIAVFYRNGLGLMHEETALVEKMDVDFNHQLEMSTRYINGHKESPLNTEMRRNLWALFFPEGVYASENREEKINAIRHKREVEITKLNKSPIVNPAMEMLFTSNVLLTLPEDTSTIDNLPFSGDFIKNLKITATEEQLYWYDHPIQIGVKPDQNQAICGLRGLNEMMAFEKARGNADKDARLTCILSVSVTHKGLHGIARKYLQEEFQKIEPLPHLDVFVFTEVETHRLIDEILYPAAVKYLDVMDIGILTDVVGVDGEYGRHYSFLKAISALWNVIMSKGLKGVFKIDLDQVFPQEELVKETGSSAFEHFKTALWGAEGKDRSGDHIELGMIAGGLVRKEDIETSIYTSNIKPPPEMRGGEGIFFYSRLPMALSAEAEVCMRFPNGRIDGKGRCIQRVHVIGGMNGILVSSLRKFRPFSPSFIGRAEDQAYLLSVLFKQIKGDLRYVHKSGLIMRQDISTISKEALNAGEVGRQVGDLVRILMFTYFSRALPWPVSETKDYLEPFAGCFISKIPITIVYSRMAMSIAEQFAEGSHESTAKAMAIQSQGAGRLSKTITYLVKNPNPLIERMDKERKAWDLYYNVIDAIEENLNAEDFFALKLLRRAENFLSECRISIGKISEHGSV